MARIILWPKNEHGLHTRKPKIEDAHLPLNYMSDHSVIGLLVDDFHKAIDILRKCEAVKIRPAIRTEVSIPFPCSIHLQKIFNLLENHGIDFELSDIVDQVYQG